MTAVTPPLDHVTDARQELTVVLPVRLRGSVRSAGPAEAVASPLDVKHDGLHLIGMELLRTATARVLGENSVTHLLLALGLSVAAPAGALTTPYGRVVLSPPRGGSRP